MMKNQLAIVIPYYKIDFFEETLKSISKQTDKNFSLYIGNDTSPNDPLPLIKEYFEEGKYNYYNYLENLGGKNLAMQWERILGNVTEDWFQILGDDDIIAENFVEEFYKQIDEVEENKINVIKISQAFVDEHTNRYTEFTSYDKNISTEVFWKNKFIDYHRSSLSEHIFNRNKYNKLGFRKYPLAWHTDDMAVIEYSISNEIYFISSTHVLVRFTEKSISGDINNDTNNKEKDLASLQFFTDMLNLYKNYIPKDMIEQLLIRNADKCWELKQENKVNLYGVYCYLGQPINLLKVPYKNYILSHHAKK